MIINKQLGVNFYITYFFMPVVHLIFLIICMIIQLRVSPMHIFKVFRNGIKINELFGALSDDASEQECSYYKVIFIRSLVQGFSSLLFICFGVLA